jgi:hypothetical protein
VYTTWCERGDWVHLAGGFSVLAVTGPSGKIEEAVMKLTDPKAGRSIAFLPSCRPAARNSEEALQH